MSNEADACRTYILQDLQTLDRAAGGIGSVVTVYVGLSV
jgi:hypothetical protein